MKKTLAFALLAVLALAGTTVGQEPAPGTTDARDSIVGPDSVWTANGVVVSRWDASDRALAWELAVPATIEEVWRAWTVPEAMTTWAAPGAHVDLRPGGRWEVWFCPECPPGERGSDANRILEIVPGERLVFEAGAPHRFPTVREEKTRFELRLEPVGEHHTLVRGIQTGWKEGEEWDRAFAYLADANATWLGWLHRRFTRGPIDWEAMRGE